MVQILELSYGPLVVLPEILAHVGKVREAYIYGSWAARYAGAQVVLDHMHPY